MLRLAVITQPLTVIACDNNRGRATTSCNPRLKRLHETAQLLIHCRHFRAVRVFRVTAAIRLGWFVRRMGIEVMHPHKQRLLASRLRQMRQRSVSRLTRRALCPSARQLIVVHIEPEGESEPPSEHKRRHKGRRAITGGLERLGHHRMRGRKESRVLVDAVATRVRAGHHRTVRRQRLWHSRVRLREHAPASGQSVERRRLHPNRARSDRVGARGIKRDEQDGGPRRYG